MVDWVYKMAEGQGEVISVGFTVVESMAEVHLLPQDILLDDGEIETLDSASYWPPFLDQDDMFPSDPDSLDLSEFDRSSSDHYSSFHAAQEEEIFDYERDGCVEIIGSESEETDLNYSQNHHRQVNLVFDLLDCCEEQIHGGVEHSNGGSVLNPYCDEPRFGLVDENDEMGTNYLELGLGLESIDRIHGDGNDDGFMMEEFRREFYVNRHRSETGGSSSGTRVVRPFRVDGSESDEDEEEDGVLGIDLHSEEDDDDDDGLDGGHDEMGLPLCWDCLRLDDQREPNEEFEWEEVDERVDEREVLSMVIDVDEERSVSTEIESDEIGEEGTEAAMRTLDWEVLLAVNNYEALLAVNNLERNLDLDHDADHEDYIYPAEYEMLFGQFAENESSIRGSPPAAKSVIDNLVSVVVSQEDVQNKNAVCAVCKDDVSTEEQVKKLPCSHYYHGDCIIPWLHIRNTCPVCRYELLTDDPDYERMKTLRAGQRPSSNTQVRYDFQIFPEN